MKTVIAIMTFVLGSIAFANENPKCEAIARSVMTAALQNDFGNKIPLAVVKETEELNDEGEYAGELEKIEMLRFVADGITVTVHSVLNYAGVEKCQVRNLSIERY